MAHTYGNGSNSSIGSQINTHFYQKKALVEAAKEMYFGQLADVTNMPRNFGKTIKAFHYLPMLEDYNVNSEGLDANGSATGTYEVTIILNRPEAGTDPNMYASYFCVGTSAVSAAAAVSAAKDRAMQIWKNDGLTVIGTYATDKATAEAAGWTVDDTTYGEAADAVSGAGNLYGSSKDVGYITGKMPTLSESGGRVNRVGFKRVELEGTLAKYGFFTEYTQESLDFDTDEELMMHINREMVNGANEITEDLLQIDLLNSAGIVRYAGAATSESTLDGDTGSVTEITYEDLMRLSIDLDNSRCPKNTKIIAGSRMIDTKTINAARYMYVGSEVLPSLKVMEDPFGNQAFIPVNQYASAGEIARGEIGCVDQFRIINVPEMMHWAGVGATVGTNEGYRASGYGGTEKYDVFPMLVVGSESFTTVGFQTDGKTVKFDITHKKPGKEVADRNDPYGELGFMSIKWYYGFMVLRPERIALIKTIAKW